MSSFDELDKKVKDSSGMCYLDTFDSVICGSPNAEFVAKKVKEYWDLHRDAVVLEGKAVNYKKLMRDLYESGEDGWLEAILGVIESATEDGKYGDALRGLEMYGKSRGYVRKEEIGQQVVFNLTGAVGIECEKVAEINEVVIDHEYMETIDGV